MGLLRLNNDDLRVKDWKLVAYGENKGGRITIPFRKGAELVKTLEKILSEISNREGDIIKSSRGGVCRPGSN